VAARTPPHRPGRRPDGQPPSAKARTELNVAISYVERAARRLSAEQGHARHARTLERLSGELDEVLARLIAADQRHKREP
jgi:hypothetical protein